MPVVIYNTYNAGFEIGTATLIDKRMYFDTLIERDNLHELARTPGIFTFIGENQKAYVSDIVDGVFVWIPITGYVYKREIELFAGDEEIIDSTVHMMPMVPTVSVVRRIQIGGLQHLEPIECTWTFDQNNDFHITSNSHVIAIINMVHNG